MKALYEFKNRSTGSIQFLPNAARHFKRGRHFDHGSFELQGGGFFRVFRSGRNRRSLRIQRGRIKRLRQEVPDARELFQYHSQAWSYLSLRRSVDVAQRLCAGPGKTKGWTDSPSRRSQTTGKNLAIQARNSDEVDRAIPQCRTKLRGNRVPGDFT